MKQGERRFEKKHGGGKRKKWLKKWKENGTRY